MKNLLKIEGYDLLSKKVYRILKKEIIKGSFEPGDKILEGKIAEQMGISKTPVREAIRELAAEGFVILSPNQGVVVRSVSAKDIREVLQIRSVLEGLAARLATYVITEKKIEELENYNKKMEKLENKIDVFAYSEVDVKFHESIANICENKQLIKIRKNISSQSLRCRISSLRIPGRLQKTTKEHWNIIEAIKAKDPERADRMGRKHIENALKNILNNVIEKKENTNMKF
jgi:DNA-binding GntR family transcriptional regulator